MAKTLKTLIKVHKHLLDEKRRELVVLEEAKQKIVLYIEGLKQELAREQEFVFKNPEKGYTFANFLEHVRDKTAEARQRIAKLDKEIQHLRDQIAEAYGDLKKFEIIKDAKEKRARKEQALKEQNTLDEIGGVLHQRKEQVT